MVVELTMPSEGDMVLVNQEGGKITLAPVFFGGECAGPHISVEYESEPGTAVCERYRIKFRSNGRVELKKADTE